MATLRMRKGVYFVDYRVDGVRRRVSTKTSDKKIARAILKDYDARIARANHLGVPFDDLKKAESSKSDSSIPVFFRKFTEHCRQRYAPGNLHSDFARLNAWRDYFARKSVRYLAQITPAHVNEFNISVLAGKKPKTLKNHLSLLKTALNYAVENGWIEENPIRKVKPPKVVSEPNWFTKGEIEKLIAEAEEPLKTAIIILLNTGLRRGELFHLRWRDIDMKKRVLRVQPHKGFTPKGRKSRSVPLNKRVSGILKRLKQDSKYAYRPYDWDGQLSVQFLSLTRELSIEGRLHDLRHTFASHLVMEGNPIKAIQDLLGHSDIRTTMVYAHLSPDIHKSVVESIQF